MGEELEEEDAYNLTLMRALKVALHELGHMFGLMHCIYYECNMNSYGDVLLTDTRPIYFCAVCYRKLSLVLQFDHLKRYKALADVSAQFGGRFSEYEEWFGKRHDAMAEILKDLKPPNAPKEEAKNSKKKK